MRQILTPGGDLVGEPIPSVAVVRSMYEGMVAGRQYDRKCTALQRQGRLATYAPFEGQEAAQIGSAATLRPDDWVVATYRDAAAMWFHGYPWVNLILGRTGDERGGSPPEGVRVLPPSITVGAHMIHAVGLGWAALLRGEDSVALTYFGDGATSEGDFHEAMNFAGVYRTPTIFLCQNNGWAISLPTERQTASETIAQKATAYGMPGILVESTVAYQDLFTSQFPSTTGVDNSCLTGSDFLSGAVCTDLDTGFISPRVPARKVVVLRSRSSPVTTARQSESSPRESRPISRTLK